MQGLSPRVRGNRGANGDDSAFDGPIPACAGQPAVDCLFAVHGWAYPRVCGATLDHAFTLKPPWGLSPRVRGNRAFGTFLQARAGPIPACAGQPGNVCTCAKQWRAYPRVCGATVRRVSWCQPAWGLSPRVRGNPCCGLYQALGVGPIPACAGQPWQSWSVYCAPRAYPRVCGATGCWYSIRSVDRGLSPRVRGNLAQLMQRGGVVGPIPACAGQPSMMAMRSCGATAYPRVCGATGFLNDEVANMLGLSPRVRGNRAA